MPKKKQKKINRKLKYFIGIVILSAILCLLIYIVYKIASLVINPTNPLIVTEGKISEEESTVGYVIRDETVLEGSEGQTGLIQIKNEGEKVAKGDSIFKYYTANEEELNTQIQTVDSQIEKALQEQTDMLFTTSDIKALESRIQTKIDGLKDRNNIQEIQEYKNDINSYITKKAKIIGELSPAGSYIKELIAQKTELQNQLYESTEYVNAPQSGIVSYRIDNLESVITVENISNLTKGYLESLNFKTGQIVTTSDEKGKIINNFECYIAVPINSERTRSAQVNSNITIRLSNKEEIKATIAYKNEDLLILNIITGVESLTNYRKISLDIIWWQCEGLKVPKNAVVYESGLSYVVINKNGKMKTALVEVVQENENYCIIDNYDIEELQKLGYSISEINSMEKINLYDEVVLNPDMENIAKYYNNIT